MRALPAEAAARIRGGLGEWPLLAAGFLATWLLVRAAPYGWRHATLVLVGLALGAALYHASFGFAAAYRRLFVQRDATAVYAQLAMLALATALFAPLLAAGEAFGQPLVGAAAPVGLQVAIGAFLFGIGMQLAGGCGSGTLYALGGGSARMGVALVAFCAGGFWASLHMDAWARLPDWEPGLLGARLGWPAAILLQLAFIALLAVLLRRSVGAPSAGWATWRGGGRAWITGPWPLAVGAAVLAFLNLATLVLSGHPWTITWGFTLWAAKAAVLLGWDPAQHDFWLAPFQRQALATSVFRDVTSIMNIAVAIGALAAAGAAGQFRVRAIGSARTLAAALLGGLAMGYGARLAFGCNVGALFSGVASTSLHGWLWIASALPGAWVGVRLRPRFGLAN
jgi:uncharacterized membrane protein YedE/YeeE